MIQGLKSHFEVLWKVSANNALVYQANREVNSEPALQHQCPDPRTESQIELLKKQHHEEIKRKNYDIKKLKEVRC